MGKKVREFRHFIDDILESIQKIEDYSLNLSEEDFQFNFEKQDAIARRLEIIGEAVKNIPVDVKNQFTDIPWKSIAGLRDVIAHDYFGILPKRLWNIVKKDIPIFKVQIIQVKSKLKF
ncbi:MAG: DUF86 domain-containing protein [Cyclobacteriaceae bacterium]|nr:DUF86 domain-containing protein [Cyclobacteriaceae bacterium]